MIQETVNAVSDAAPDLWNMLYGVFGIVAGWIGAWLKGKGKK